MARQPIPSPEPDPEPDEPPENGDFAAAPERVSLAVRVENLENRMTALEERVAAPPVGIGRRP